MSIITKISLLITVLFFLLSCDKNMQEIEFNPPETPKSIVYDTLHGKIIEDPYRWLENKDDSLVYKWSKEQHEYTIDFILNNGADIKGLKEELRAYLDRDYNGAPFFIGKREFVYKRKKGEQHNTLFTIIENKEIRIFSPTDLDESGNTSWGGVSFTENGDKVAIGTQYKGNEINTYRIFNTITAEQIGDTIDNLRGFSWAKNEEFAYITIRTADMIKKQEPLMVFKHKLGNSRDTDIFLMQAKDAKDFSSVWDSKESNITFYSTGDFYSNTLSYSKQNNHNDRNIIFDSKEYKATPYIKNNKAYFLTNYEAPNFKIMVAPIENMHFDNWEVFYSEKESVLENFVITSDFILIQYKQDVLNKISVYSLDGEYIKELELPEFGSVGGMSYNKELNKVFVSLMTYKFPSKAYKVDGKTLEWEFYYQDEAPINTDEIESELIFYSSKDGTKIPMFLNYKKGIVLDGSNPTLLYGYGGFNISMTPHYLGDVASFINRGGVYAVAALRGGSEYGEEWHKAGMLDRKQNVFDDFISAAEFLIESKYTKPEKLCIYGGSNGGLLTGACLVQRPDLYKAVISAVPLLDMVRYHQFLIARYWIPEYGSSENEIDFLNLLSYSPYHNIKEGINYPTTLIKAGENDTRVDPLHAKKFAAALQNNRGQKNPILLFVDFDSGHGSGQSTEKQVENKYIHWKFIMNQLEIK